MQGPSPVASARPDRVSAGVPHESASPTRDAEACTAGTLPAAIAGHLGGSLAHCKVRSPGRFRPPMRCRLSFVGSWVFLPIVDSVSVFVSVFYRIRPRCETSRQIRLVAPLALHDRPSHPFLGVHPLPVVDQLADDNERDQGKLGGVHGFTSTGVPNPGVTPAE